jgi:hypothetical protein
LQWVQSHVWIIRPLRICSVIRIPKMRRTKKRASAPSPPGADQVPEPAVEESREGPFDVFVAPATLVLNDALTGVIGMRLGDQYFPSRAWSDFVATMLSWWINEVWNLGGKRWEATCRFMDGPLTVRIEKEKSGEWSLEGLSGRRA